MQLRLLAGDEVRAALPMREAIAVMRTAFGAASRGEVNAPLRSRLATDEGVTLLMPGHLDGGATKTVKIVSIHEGNPQRGLSTVVAVVVVLDAGTGLPIALVEGDVLTEIRTGAGGGLAAQVLAREDARVATVFGAGVQARAQLEALLAVRAIEEVRVISRGPDSARRFAEQVAGWPDAPVVRTGFDPAEAVRTSDVVLTATTSTTPVFPGEALAPGTHVTAVGSFRSDMRELDETTLRRASKVVVDLRDSAMAEAGELIAAGVPITAELGEVVDGRAPGREDDDEITVFKSVGMAAQDVAAAEAVLAAAQAQGLGRLVEL